VGGFKIDCTCGGWENGNCEYLRLVRVRIMLSEAGAGNGAGSGKALQGTDC
jgi:hypothetical protein